MAGRNAAGFQPWRWHSLIYKEKKALDTLDFCPIPDVVFAEINLEVGLIGLLSII